MSGERTLALGPAALALKHAARALVGAAGGVEAAARYCRAGKSQLSDYGHRHVAAFMPIDVVADLEAIAPPHVTRMLAREAGYVLIALPAADLPETAWSQHGATLLREVGDCAAGLGEALASGNDVDAAEAARLLIEADQMIDAAVGFREALKARAAQA
ncbi:MAG: phage regulatory CII family protein [Sphingomonas sp.]